MHDFASDALLQMLKKKLPPFPADAGDQVMHFRRPTWPFIVSAAFLLNLSLHWRWQVDESSRSKSPLVIKSTPAESDWRLEEGDKPSRALQVVKELHAR